MTTDAEARSALAEIEHRRRQVIGEIGLPAWYWWGLALGWVALGVIADLHHPWLSLAATAVFGAVHASIAHVVIGGRRGNPNLSVHADLAGRHTPLLVIAGLIGLALLTVVLAVIALADGARHPVTIASIVVALLILLGGPGVMAAVRRRAARSSTPS